MFEILNISKGIIQRNWILFSVLTVVTFSIASYNVASSELVFEASFVAAPYYETANDVHYKVKELSVAINDNDQEYINKYVGDSLDVHDLTNASSKLDRNHSDFTFKHIKLKLEVDVTDSSNLELWDKKLHEFYLSSSNCEENQYRGREVLKERISILAEKQYHYDVSEKNDSLKFLNILKFYLNQDSLTISDSNMVDLVFARYIAEYRNATSVNKVISLSSSHHLKKEQIVLFSAFMYTAFGPLFILLFFWAAYIEYKQNKLM